MFCTCSRSCSIATFISTEMLVSSSAEDFEPSVLASRMQLLDQEVEPLADLAAGLQQARDLVEVGAQARQLLGDVDADRVGGGLVERALLQRLVRHGLGGAGWPRAPRSSARGSAAAGAAPPPAPAARPASASSRRRVDALHQHRDQPRAFALARLAQAGDARLRGVERGFVEPLGGAAALAPLQHLVRRQRLRLRQPALHGAFEPRQAVQLLGLAAAASRRRRRAACARRSSTLPRRKAAPTAVRATPARARAIRPAGGSERSRKRPLTERSSTVTPAAAGGRALVRLPALWQPAPAVALA